MDQLCDVGPKVILGGNIAVHTKVIKTSKSTPRTAR
jgi:ABC-type tungstate transport system substrate-binding protein